MKNKEEASIEDLFETFLQELKHAKEYIKLDEALDVTGFSEKTLRDHMRGSVTAIGRNAWDRKEFFEYWKQLSHEKQAQVRNKTQAMAEMVDRILESRPKKRNSF